MAEIQTSKTYYLGIHPHMLDPVNLEFSSFGVLWYEEGKQRYVVSCSNEQVLYNIYTSIRDKQQERDWLEHAAVCENAAQLTGYLARAVQTHHLASIVPMELQEGSIYE